MLTALTSHDRDLVSLDNRHGAVLVSPLLQGRIFCHLGGELAHRLDVERMRHPRQNEFNNLGGNILWPAPEGGPFAFNYAPGRSEWRVQEDIASAVAPVTVRTSRAAAVAKTVSLMNRRGVSLSLSWTRRVELLDLDGEAIDDGIAAIGYTGEDTLAPLAPYSPKDVLLSAWSLEQFPGGDDVTAFAKVDRPETAINTDFYGEPAVPSRRGTDGFTLALGGSQKFQIGVRVNSGPRLIGALDRRRSLLILRQTERQEGLYFNIADNDQPRGPWAEADLYSIFNGGDMKLFELETVGSMQTDGKTVGPSRLCSKTWILAGPVEALVRWLERRHGIALPKGPKGGK